MILFMFMGLLPYVWDKSRLRRANDGLASHTRMQLITQHADGRAADSNVYYHDNDDGD